jgi:hypothetical protein
MKRVFVITILIFGLMATFSFALMQEGMMGGHSEQDKMDSGMMGSGMMGKGMMGPEMMGHGMHGMGMMGPCMMGMMHGGGMGYGTGTGMMHGMGMMGTGMVGYGNVETYRKFLNETVDLRKEIHNKRFEYFEALRNPKTKPETITKLEKEIQELQNKIYEKTPR